MADSFVLSVALRYFSAKKNEKFVSIISAISLAGITIGVAALIIVMSVMNGFHIELTNNIVGLGGDIKITPHQKTINDYPKLIEQLKTNDFVTKAIPTVFSQSMALGPLANSGVIIRGINLIDLKEKGELVRNVFDGSFSEYYGTDRVAIGSELARNLGVVAGNKIKLISPGLLPTAFGSMPRSKDFTIVAIFSSGLFDYDAATILMPLPAAQKLLSLGDEINLLEVYINDRDLAPLRTGELRSKIGTSLNVRSWMEDNRQFLNALEVERSAMFVILSLIILVAAFNIISSLFMLVKDKTKDIAILKTIGASTKQIMAVFILNGMLVGVIGTALGTTLGLVFAYNIDRIKQFLEQLSGTTIFDPAIYFLYSLPSVVNLGDVLVVTSIALILSLLATVYPAYKAASLNPIEAMRYE